jgi:hypothetical protein
LSLMVMRVIEHSEFERSFDSPSLTV